MKRIATLLLLTLFFPFSPYAAEVVSTPIASLVDLDNAPVSPSNLTEAKKDDAALLLLRAAKRENVTTAEALDELVSRQKARDAALIQLIDPNSPITHAFATALEVKLGAFLSDNVAPENKHQIALQMVQSIFLNRRDDLTSIQVLYDDAAWKQTVFARLQKNEIPELNVKLSENKKDELKNTALFVHTPGKADGKIEPAVHLTLTALAQQIGHAALADVTQAGGAVHAQFIDGIGVALPNDPGAKEWLKEWLYLRQGRAAEVAKEFKPDGALIQQAIAQSEAHRRARLAAPPALIFK